MAMLLNFIVAFAFSFVGSIPPGTLNLTVLRLGLDNKINVAWRFALAASIIEYPYAWIALKFNQHIISSPFIFDNFKLLSGIVMLLLGVLNLWSARKPTTLARRFEDSGVRKGIVLGILNPLAIPFWIGITAFLSAQGWIDLTTTPRAHGYLVGVFIGAFTLLIVLAYLARNLSAMFQSSSKLKLIPGLTLVLLGLMGIVDYILR